MFDNPGQKIQMIAKILFWICVVGIGILVVTLIGAANDVDDFYIFLALIILLIGLPSLYLSYLFFIGFGRLIETSENCERKLEEIKNKKEFTPVNIDTGSGKEDYSSLLPKL